LANVLSPNTLVAVTRGVAITPETVYIVDDTTNAVASYVSITVTPNVADTNVIITTTNSSFTFSGKYVAGFIDTIKYVEKGSSDLAQTPTVFNGLYNVPANKDLFYVLGDTNQSIIINYTVNAVFSNSSYTTFNITRTVNNDGVSVYNFLTDYFGS
jgi:hypothetical protein